LSLLTIKKRADFLRLRGGARWSNACFVLETRPRAGSSEANALGPRFGFTVTKALGGAVIRNRIRRRLKAAVIATAPDLARAEHDYVVIARSAAADRPFDDLKKDLEQAFQRVHHPAGRHRGDKAPVK
jgi:ribonuclease P protein component